MKTRIIHTIDMDTAKSQSRVRRFLKSAIASGYAKDPVMCKRGSYDVYNGRYRRGYQRYEKQLADGRTAFLWVVPAVPAEHKGN